MLRKRRGIVPYRIDTSAKPSAAPRTWRERLQFVVAEAAGAIVFTTIMVGVVVVVSPWGEPFADFIDRLAAAAH